MRPTLEILSGSPEQTEELGRALGGVLREGDVLALHGGLGSGKTCLVRGIAAGLGLDPRGVSSPTFVIVNEYSRPAAASGGAPSARGDFTLSHIDAYRLSGPDDLDTVGWDRVMDGSSIVAIEWAERLLAENPGGADARRDGQHGPLGDPAFVAHAHFTHTGPTTRRIRLEVPPTWPQRRGWTALAAAARSELLRCPTCGGSSRADGPTAPFCSDKCRLADLGRWFDGRYTISREMNDNDLNG